MLDPELAKLRDELGSLQHSIHRLSATLKIEEPHREPKDRKEVEDDEEKERDNDKHEEKRKDKAREEDRKRKK